ncbi:MAG: hypothetical protein V1898_04770 [Patescibacteria group bacterium]
MKTITKSEVIKIYRKEFKTKKTVEVCASLWSDGIWLVFYKGQRGGLTTLIGPDGGALIASCPSAPGYSKKCIDQQIKLYKKGKRVSRKDFEKETQRIIELHRSSNKSNSQVEKKLRIAKAELQSMLEDINK